MKKDPSQTHGGKRKGAGRKADDRIRVTFKLDKIYINQITGLAGREKTTFSEMMRQIVKKYFD